MRVLTVRQPWAWAIIHGGKDIENRTRNIAGAYRGPVAIHAGLSEADIDSDDPMFGLIYRPCPHEQEPKHNSFACRWCVRAAPRRYCDKGHIIGVVDLVAVHLGSEFDDDYCFRSGPNGGPMVHSVPRCSPWAESGTYHLVLANPRALATPIPAKGRLGLWTPDEGLLWAIRAQIGTPSTTSGDPS